MTDTARIIHTIAKRIPAVIPHLNANALQAVKVGGYQGIRGTYWAEIYDSVYDYLVSDRPVTSYRNKMSKAMVDAFVQAAEMGYEDGGGSLPMDDETLNWLGAAQTTELGHIADLFNRLKIEWDGLDAINEAYARADGYASTLDQIFSEAKMRGAGNKMLTFVGSDGKESCKDCQRMKGQRHRASWWVKNDLIPGSSKYECGGWNCEHILVDDNGIEFTL